MRRRLLLCIVPLLFCAAGALAEEYPPRVGQPHPNFTLPNIEDRAPVSLASYRGRKVLLIQFASW
jgi:hypothetical protein